MKTLKQWEKSGLDLEDFIHPGDWISEDLYNQFEEEYKKKIVPLKKEIKRLEQSFLDKYLIDSTGKPVKKGMTIEKEGKKYKVLDRYQQCICQYLGNVRVSALPEGKKRTVDIFPDDLCEYTIVE